MATHTDTGGVLTTSAYTPAAGASHASCDCFSDQRHATLAERMWFDLDTFVLDSAQALCIALPAAGVPAYLLRLGGHGWALVAPLSVILTVAAIGVGTASADVLTWIALVLVPLGCALALGWAAHGARPWLAVAVVPLLAIAVAGPDDPLGRGARLLLIVGSVVTAGRLLAGVTPLRYLKAGVVAMAVIDAVFIFGDFFGDENAAFNAAAPAAGLPRLQVADVGDVSTDYGDYFVAGLVGAILAAERRPQFAAAVATLVAAEAFNQLFLVVDSLPGTVPPAVVLLGFEAWHRRGRPDAPTRPGRRRWRGPPHRPQARQPAGG
jgi:hypothetical protein